MFCPPASLVSIVLKHFNDDDDDDDDEDGEDDEDYENDEGVMIVTECFKTLKCL